MGDHLRAGKPSWHVTSHPGQHSLAILPLGRKEAHHAMHYPWSGSVSWCLAEG